MANSPIDGWIEHAKHVAESSPLLNISVKANRLEKPLAAIVTAADFPIDPHHLTGAEPGSFYTIRNTAGLVPPGAGDGVDFSVGASLEFAVQVLGVQHVIVMVSPNCGLLNCLLDEDADGIASIVDGQYLPNWAQLTASAINRVGSANIPAKQRMSICSQELTRISFENLMTYSWILDRVFSGSLALHGWYYDEDNGVFSWFDPATDEFVSG